METDQDQIVEEVGGTTLRYKMQLASSIGTTYLHSLTTYTCLLFTSAEWTCLGLECEEWVQTLTFRYLHWLSFFNLI